MIRTCTFLDNDIWFKADSTGHNKVGYLTAEDVVVYPVRRHWVRIPLKTVIKKMRGKELMTFRVQWPEDREAGVEAFFTQNVLNPELMQRGMGSIFKRDFEFFDYPLRLPVLSTISADEREDRWSKMMQSIQPCDLVQIIDQSSIVSRLIAKVDIGTWSHTASYVGRGMVLEAITSGVVKRDINVYRDVRYRIGIYRVPGITEEQRFKMLVAGYSCLGRRYNWKGLFRLGIKKLLRLRRSRYKDGEVSPNDLVSMGICQLVHIV